MTDYKILVVDDMLVNLKILEKILNTAGYETVLASNGEEALELVQKETFHCILLDIVMPGLDGYEVIAKLKNMPLISEIPVIFITGREGAEETVKGLEAGAVDYIPKPFHPVEVQLRVQLHIRLYTTIQSLATAQAETLMQINNAQHSLLKQPEDIPHANFSVYYCSLHAAGGDIYDIIEISETQIGYFIGDFAGHQISTGFLTSSVKALLQQNCNSLSTPVQSMYMVNSVLCQLMKPGQYLTACYAVLDTVTNKLTVVNMGHPPMLVIQSNGIVLEVGHAGDVLGVFEDSLYKEDAVNLLPSDRILLYTDGLIEGEQVWSAYTRKFKKLVETLPITQRDEYLETILTETEQFRGDVDDDIMVLVADVPGELPKIEKVESDHSLSIRFPSTVRFIPQVSREAFRWAIKRVNLKDQYGLKLVLSEALTNAVTHGNEQNISKFVDFSIKIESSSLEIMISDEGRGFKRNVDSSSLTDQKAVSGRGLPLYKAYGYTTSFNEKGNSITLSIDYKCYSNE